MTTGGAESESPAVCLRGIRKRFGFREVLRGVDLTVARGECLAIFGPNGAGKSTLLRIAATQWRPSHGDGEILGHDIQRDVRSIRRRLGVVFHHSLLRHELTLDENVRFAADLYGIRLRAGGRADSLIERLGLAARRRDQVGTFSQGMQKRANIIRSLLHDPDLWLLDEPFSGLDPQGRELLSDMVRDFVRQGGAVVLVTHQVELGKDLATRTLSMDDGEIVDAASESRGGAA
ncbi:MAG: ABC transporter ATP-binding protein [Planctomycetota bacterium]|nr:ABC transporter ATP-binding protein [Planctomycetota bacterium]